MSKTTIELYTTLTHTHAHMKKPIHRSLCNLINAHEMEHEFIHTGEIQLPFDYNEFVQFYVIKKRLICNGIEFVVLIFG